jgi:hypothetical protein
MGCLATSMSIVTSGCGSHFNCPGPYRCLTSDAVPKDFPILNKPCNRLPGSSGSQSETWNWEFAHDIPTSRKSYLQRPENAKKYGLSISPDFPLLIPNMF